MSHFTTRFRSLAGRLLVLTLLCVGLLFASGCDGFLETTPQGNLTTENFYESADDAERAIAAAYSGLQDPADFLLPYVITFGNVASDDARKGGESGNDQPGIQSIQNFVHNPTNNYVFTAWNELYQGVRLANLVIDRVPPIEMDEELKARYIAEAKFLRAYYYHYLLLHFGLEGEGVPLILEPVQNDEANVEKTPEAEVWAQVEQDLLDAAEVLPESYDTGNLGRATKGAAEALLVKAYMFQEKFPEAETLAFDIVENGPYRLNPSYAEVFTLDGEYGPGSIFEINYDNVVARQEGTDATVYQTSRSTWGYGFNCPTQSLVDSYESGDPRLDATIIEDGEEMPDGSVISTAASPTGYHNEKVWIPENSWPQNNGGEVIDGPTNRRVIRLAQVLLWHAEAATQNNNLGAARNSLNAVRARARDNDNNPSNDPPGVLPNITTNDQALLLEAVYREQRIELAMESHRYFTLVRQGRIEDAMTAFDPNTQFTAGKHERLPIPQLQLDLSQGVISQNPGY
jgi:hypothetical protein